MTKPLELIGITPKKKLREYGFKITIDQWLVIKSIMENPDIDQQEIGELVFKDNASVTRIIEILVQSGYIERTTNQEDRRKSNLKVTISGKQIIKKVHGLVLENRKTALEGVTLNELDILNKTLNQIIRNCKSK